jgi:hypothetical protein
MVVRPYKRVHTALFLEPLLQDIDTTNIARILRPALTELDQFVGSDSQAGCITRFLRVYDLSYKPYPVGASDQLTA